MLTLLPFGDFETIPAPPPSWAVDDPSKYKVHCPSKTLAICSISPGISSESSKGSFEGKLASRSAKTCPFIALGVTHSMSNSDSCNNHRAFLPDRAGLDSKYLIGLAPTTKSCAPAYNI